VTRTFFDKVMPLTAGSVLAVAAFAATALATSGPAGASCGDVGAAEQCVAAPCPEAQQLDAESGQCREKTNQAAVAQSPAPGQTPAANQVAQAPEAPLKAAWERQFGPLPSPHDVALARVENPSVALPGVGLPGLGVNLFNVAPNLGAGAAGAAAVAGPAMAAMAAAPPALPAPPQGLPPLPYPCFGFGTPIPFVGFSTGC
jgi:hypothetical protein